MIFFELKRTPRWCKSLRFTYKATLSHYMQKLYLIEQNYFASPHFTFQRFHILPTAVASKMWMHLRIMFSL